MIKKVILISVFFLFSSCYFGAGLVEVDLPGNYSLFGNNSYEEIVILYNSSEHNNQIIVKETVFAVGYNKEYIIAKSYPVNSNVLEEDKRVLYHILLVDEVSPQVSKGLTFEEYKSKRKELEIPNDINFSIVFHEVARN